MKLKYFQLNYYAGFDFKGFPIGEPVTSHIFNAPESSVLLDGPTMFPGASLEKATHFARQLGYEGRFGIEELGV